MEIKFINLYLYFRGEHLGVRNAEGSFYLCQTLQQIYKHSKKIRIQWLSEKPESNPKKDIYIPEYYDQTGKNKNSCFIINIKMQIDQTLILFQLNF